MRLKSVLGLLFFVFTLIHCVNAQTCKIPSVSTEELLKGNNRSIFIHHEIYKVKSLKLKFPLPYKIPAIMEIYPISDTELLFDLQDKERTNLLKKVASNEKFEFCLEDLPTGSYLLKIGDSRGVSSITMLRITITENGSKKQIVIR
jgi:hypothetical protein